MEVEADRERCISAGRCMATAPNVFDQDDDGIVLVLAPRPDAADEDLVRESAYLCPALAIQLTE
ncbi:ferredoxin [Kibdelosporangium lantanae]